MLGIKLFRNKLNQQILRKDILKRIKKGDSLLREKFIGDYKPFILKTVSQVTGKYVEVENSEEYSVGLMAFNEAIDSYDECKNPVFLDFCRQVIKRRVIDYIRKNEKNYKVYPFTCFENDMGTILNEKSPANARMENIETKEQIEIFERNLQEFGITLEDLVRCSPKHRDSKRIAIEIARHLVGRNDLYQKLIKSKKIPLADLMKQVDVNQKTIERNRRFIIAVCLILKSDLNILKGYISSAEEGGKSVE